MTQNSNKYAADLELARSLGFVPGAKIKHYKGRVVEYTVTGYTMCTDNGPYDSRLNVCYKKDAIGVGDVTYSRPLSQMTEMIAEITGEGITVDGYASHQDRIVVSGSNISIPGAQPRFAVQPATVLDDEDRGVSGHAVEPRIQRDGFGGIA